MPRPPPLASMQEANESDSSDDERLFTDEEDSSDDEIAPPPKRAKQAIKPIKEEQNTSDTEDTVESIDIRMKQETEEEKTTDDEAAEEEENNNNKHEKGNNNNDDNQEQVHIDYLWPHYHDIDPTNTEETVAMAFCCANCKCSDDKKEEYGDAICNASENYYYHRYCCHDIKKFDENWVPPFLKAAEVACEKLGQTRKVRKWKKEEIEQKARAAKSTESEIENDQSMPDPASKLWTDPLYEAHVGLYNKEVKAREDKPKKKAVLLDLFGGIGGGLVVCKRLGIALSKVIHVEHDKVAMHVTKFQHDPAYNSKLPDHGIEHVYISKFEELEKDLDDFLRKHGPIDIVIGGPPCVDTSGLNAYGEGTQGAQGQYLLKMSKLIHKIQARQENRRLFFLMENVVFGGNKDRRFVDYMAVDEEIGVRRTIWDAKYLSPCKRNRSYWLNVLVNELPTEYALRDLGRLVWACLEDGWTLPGTEQGFAQVNTFLAAKSRIDDDRMLKVQMLDGNPIKGTFSVVERERMLGFPEGYVGDAVDNLFRTLVDNALCKQDATELPPWSETLDSKYLCFSGEQFKYYGFDLVTMKPMLKMTPPTDQPDFFNAEEYSKRLLGNSFSIPIVEHLLQNLKPLFQSTEYDGYDYHYKWAPPE